MKVRGGARPDIRNLNKPKKKPEKRGILIIVRLTLKNLKKEKKREISRSFSNINILFHRCATVTYVHLICITCKSNILN